MSLYGGAWAIALIVCVLAPAFCSLFGGRYDPSADRNYPASKPHEGER